MPDTGPAALDTAALSRTSRREPPSHLETLRAFEAMPDSGHVRAHVVAAVRCVTVRTVYSHIKAGRFPKPTKFGARVAVWNVGELRRFMASEKASQ